MQFLIPPPEAILGGYKLGARTDTHEKVAKVFMDHPNNTFRMIQIAKKFPEYNAETIRIHIRKLHEQAFIVKRGDFEYQLNPAYKTPEQKRAIVAEHLRSGENRLRVVEAPKEKGPYAPVSGSISGSMQEVMDEADRRIEKAVAEARKDTVTTVSSAGELLKRHLNSLRERMETNASFTKADIEMLEELEVLAGL